MARKKTVVNTVNDIPTEHASSDQSKTLGHAFNQLIEMKFGSSITPSPYVTQFGVKPLDALLGGGFVSSQPIVFTSTPETGKSTIAFQLAKRFIDAYEESVVLYVDIEGSGNTVDDFGRPSRITTFQLDSERFVYQPIRLNVLDVFNLIESICVIVSADIVGVICLFT